MSARILIVEDDAALAKLVSGNLKYEGFTVDCVSDGTRAVAKARELKPDLVLLDIAIPGMNGFTVCRELRKGRYHPPIIMLTAWTQLEHKVRSLNAGADDYVTKPFVFDELLARIHAVLRRSRRAVEKLTLGDVQIDFVEMRATKRGEPLMLTSREYAFLQYLAERPSRPVSREELLLAVWGYDEVPFTRTVDNFVARLRRKIEPDAQHPRFIRTVHGGGYCLSIAVPEGAQ